jgi:hypothetical protein
VTSGQSQGASTELLHDLHDLPDNLAEMPRLARKTYSTDAFLARILRH